jgi:hypothetical protein
MPGASGPWSGRRTLEVPDPGILPAALPGQRKKVAGPKICPELQLVRGPVVSVAGPLIGWPQGAAQGWKPWRPEVTWATTWACWASPLHPSAQAPDLPIQKPHRLAPVDFPVHTEEESSKNRGETGQCLFRGQVQVALPSCGREGRFVPRSAVPGRVGDVRRNPFLSWTGGRSASSRGRDPLPGGSGWCSSECWLSGVVTTKTDPWPAGQVGIRFSAGFGLSKSPGAPLA